MKIKFDVEKNIQLINQTLGLSHELLCSDVITVKVKIQLNSSPQLASTLSLGGKGFSKPSSIELLRQRSEGNPYL